MKIAFAVTLSLFAGIALAAEPASVPVGQYVQGSKGSNNLPDTGLNHWYLPITGSATLDGTWSKSSSITQSHSKTSSGGGSSEVSFQLRVNYENTSELGASNSNFYVAVVGSQHAFQFGQACGVSPGANVIYGQACVNGQFSPGDLTTPQGTTFTLYESASPFTSASFNAQSALQCTVTAPGVTRNGKSGTYTLSNLPYELTITSDRGNCYIVPGVTV